MTLTSMFFCLSYNSGLSQTDWLLKVFVNVELKTEN